MSKKISDLSLPTLPLTGTELIEMSQDSTSVQVTVSELQSDVLGGIGSFDGTTFTVAGVIEANDVIVSGNSIYLGNTIISEPSGGGLEFDGFKYSSDEDGESYFLQVVNENVDVGLLSGSKSNIYSKMSIANSADASQFNGITNTLENNDGDRVSSYTLTGIRNTVDFRASGTDTTIQNMYSIYSALTIDLANADGADYSSGTVVGHYVSTSMAGPELIGTLGTMYGLRVSMSTDDGKTVNNLYGLRIQTDGLSGPNDYYGIYIDSITNGGAGNAYGLMVKGQSVLNQIEGTLYIGIDDTNRGTLYLYGGPEVDGGAGGLMRIYLAASDDDTIEYYQISVSSDDLFIGPANDTDALKYDGGTNSWRFSQGGGLYNENGNIYNGSDDSINGNLYMYGGAEGGDGGNIQLYLEATFDDSIEYYRIRAYEDDLLIGPDTDPDALKHDGNTRGWIMSHNGSVVLETDSTGVVVTGSVRADDLIVNGSTIYLGNVVLKESIDGGLESGPSKINLTDLEGFGGTTARGYYLYTDISDFDTEDVRNFRGLDLEMNTFDANSNSFVFESININSVHTPSLTDTRLLRFTGINANMTLTCTDGMSFSPNEGNIYGLRFLINANGAGEEDSFSLNDIYGIYLDVSTDTNFDQTVDEGYGIRVNIRSKSTNDIYGIYLDETVNAGTGDAYGLMVKGSSVLNEIEGDLEIGGTLSLAGVDLIATAGDLNEKEFTIFLDNLDSTSEISIVCPIAGEVISIYSSVTGDPGADVVISGNVNGGSDFPESITISNGSAKHTVDSIEISGNNSISAGQTIRLISDGGAVNSVGAWFTVVVTFVDVT